MIMYECDNCKNKEICKTRKLAIELSEDVKILESKYKDFYGRLKAYCDYYIPVNVEITIRG